MCFAQKSLLLFELDPPNPYFNYNGDMAKLYYTSNHMICLDLVWIALQRPKIVWIALQRPKIVWIDPN